VDELEAGRRLRLAVLAGAAIVIAIVAGVAIGNLKLSGQLAVVAAVFAVALPLVCWRFPAGSVILMAASAVLVEQFQLPGLPKTLTEQIPFFRSLSTGAGLSGIYVNPVELVIAAIAVIWVIKSAGERRLSLPRSYMAAGVASLLVLVVAQEVHGLGSGGDFKASLWELRPWLYIGLLYLLASQLHSRRETILALLWVVIVGTGLKGVEGCIVYLQVRSYFPRPSSILEHEESFFFGLYILLTLCLWLFGIRGRLRRVATALLPFVVLADLANHRRTAWVIVGCGVGIILLAAWYRFPADKRWKVQAVALFAAAIGAAYLPLFWNGSGTIAQPARAIRSAINPSTRDAASDLYRIIEDFNLGTGIKNTTPFGAGFGRVLVQYEKNVDISKLDPNIIYQPHNTLLYVWLRLGFPGAIAFWWLIGAAVRSAARLARGPDSQLAMFGILVIVALGAYVIQGWLDQGVVSLRIAVLVGCLLGSLEAAHRLSRPRPLVVAA
jgi:O-Antigen ligase